MFIRITDRDISQPSVVEECLNERHDCSPSVWLILPSIVRLRTGVEIKVRLVLAHLINLCSSVFAACHCGQKRFASRLVRPSTSQPGQMVLNEDVESGA
jgi:hypothetical protein